MLRVLKVFGVGLLILGGLILGTWALFYPVVPHSPKGWAALIFLGVPFVILCAFIRQWLSDNDPLPDWPKPARILFFAVCGLFALAVLFVPLGYLFGLIRS